MKLLQILSVMLVGVLMPMSAAFANLLITPLQVVMEGRERSAQIILVNNGNRTNTYRLLWEQFVQVEGLGGYAPLSDAAKYNVVEPQGSRHLMDFAVFTPRQITLAPNEKQTVRIAVRRPADLADGEHKSHLKFQIVPNSDDGFSGKDPSLDQSEIRFGARVNASFSIPVIYRSGDYDVQVSMQQPSFKLHEKTGKLIVQVPMSRSGLHGVIGQLDAFYTPNGGGSEVLIGSIANTNLFPEIASRLVSVPTNLDGLNPGILRLVYKKTEGQAHEHEVMSELVVPVAN